MPNSGWRWAIGGKFLSGSGWQLAGHIGSPGAPTPPRFLRSAFLLLCPLRSLCGQMQPYCNLINAKDGEREREREKQRPFLISHHTEEREREGEGGRQFRSRSRGPWSEVRRLTDCLVPTHFPARSSPLRCRRSEIIRLTRKRQWDKVAGRDETYFLVTE